MEDKEPDQVARAFGYPGWGFWLNGLSRILAKTGFCEELHRWAQEKVQEPSQSLVKQRIFVSSMGHESSWGFKSYENP